MSSTPPTNPPAARAALVEKIKACATAKAGHCDFGPTEPYIVWDDAALLRLLPPDAATRTVRDPRDMARELVRVSTADGLEHIVFAMPGWRVEIKRETFGGESAEIVAVDEDAPHAPPRDVDRGSDGGGTDAMNGRGLRVYGRVKLRDGGTVRVQDSSLAGKPHGWLFFDDRECVEHLGRHHRPSPHFTVAEAKRIRAALDRFIAMTEER